MAIGLQRIHHNKVADSMVKFKVLKYNQIHMGWLGIYSHNLREPKKENIKSIIPLCVLSLISIGWISSIVIILGNSSKSNLSVVFKSIELLCGWLQVFGMFLTMCINFNKVKHFHIKLQNIVDEGEV